MIVISVIKAWLFNVIHDFFEVKLGFLSLFEKMILRKIWLRICNELFRECRLVINVRNAKTAYKSFKSKDLLFTVSNENWHLIQAPLIYLPPKCQPGTVEDLRGKSSLKKSTPPKYFDFLILRLITKVNKLNIICRISDQKT